MMMAMLHHLVKKETEAGILEVYDLMQDEELTCFQNLRRKWDNSLPTSDESKDK